MNSNIFTILFSREYSDFLIKNAFFYNERKANPKMLLFLTFNYV